jgi:hypothetical protein
LCDLHPEDDASHIGERLVGLRLRRLVGTGAEIVHAERVLRMLGVEAADAAVTARRPLPDSA